MERRQSIRVETASIPVLLGDVSGELIDLSLEGAAVIHRSPVRAGTPLTLVFPSYTGNYVPCRVLRSLVTTRRSEEGTEYVFRSAISFLPMDQPEQEPLREFLQLQMERLEQARRDNDALPVDDET